MADAKYGRLFTEDDMVRIAAGIAHIYSGRDDIIEDAVRQAVGTVLDHFDGHLSEQPDRPLTFPADEPLFLLRGQDRCAGAAVGAYLVECARVAGEEHTRAVADVSIKLGEWQREHPDRVKTPD